ncbi:cupin domain-containing protein [Aestuariivirga litoralis]|uniref:cupin domain-containing protein n=1 Tax=Aestuariivirga litoralis TaxID=2650924 RepID=UPI0018C4F23E|nr:cupin domain-containing protein [Aestuariivirga litoralis]MBG1233857.1 DUF861 domain-containing protein [Aestuariivirga litoralis]
MTHPLIITAKTDVALSPSPIEPAWIHEGDPMASNAVLATSADGTATTIVWQCTPGKFEWHYDSDETIYFLEGSVVISADGMAPKRLGPGDVLYFKKGAVANWHIEQQIRKLAFFRRTVPGPIGFAIRVMNKLKRKAGGTATRPAGAMAMSAN